ncbi:hypothetical protein ACF082_34300 [Streptomyces lydicus]|uniref:hypothetical protein n=1 Tax=Streptomyces lydicus TaxID=47763 RepID=UPI0036FD30C4
MNVEPHSFPGYQPDHTVAEATVTAADNTPLRLVFDTTTTANVYEAANAAFVVGNRQSSDDRGQNSPTDVSRCPSATSWPSPHPTAPPPTSPSIRTDASPRSSPSKTRTA